jgi:hypothetical protein
MYKSEVIDKDTVEKRIATRLIVLWKKKRKKLFHDRIIIEDGMIILDLIVLHIQIEMMQHEKHKIFHRTGCP